MPETSHRTHRFTESVIRMMTRVALDHGAINLAQGFPDFDPPPELLQAAKRALEGSHHQYAVTWGAPRFRAALAAKLSRTMGVPVDPDRNLTVTCGSTEAMMAAMMSVCNPGDKVIVFSPFYENYGADIILSGAEPVYVRLRPPDYDFDPTELRAAFACGVKALVLCNPSNPCGKVFARSELELILSLAREYDAFVITDEVYEHIVYEPHQHAYIAALPGAMERVIVCGSLSKTYSITGWRLGYVLGRPAVSTAVRKVHDFLTVGAAAPLQEAAITALELPPSYYEQLRASYTRKRELLLGYLARAGLEFTRPQGAYYVMVDVSRFGYPSDAEFCLWLAREVGVAAVPGSSFFHEPEHRYVRLHFAKRDETLHAAGQRLLKLA